MNTEICDMCINFGIYFVRNDKSHPEGGGKVFKMIDVMRTTCLDYKNTKGTLQFKRANICPRCGKGLQPLELASAVYTRQYPLQGTFATVFNFCNLCNSCFITTYDAKIIGNKKDGSIDYKTLSQCFSEPIMTSSLKKFSEYINNLSPKFIEIYNQSEVAESHKLNQIIGMGYRKSLEFLIKDYAVHFNPDKKERIETMSLANCINTFIDNSRIKTLAEKSAWIGNDETHYVRKHLDRDVSDLKIFIDACVGYINSELAVEDANTILKA